MNHSEIIDTPNFNNTQIGQGKSLAKPKSVNFPTNWSEKAKEEEQLSSEFVDSDAEAAKRKKETSAVNSSLFKQASRPTSTESKNLKRQDSKPQRTMMNSLMRQTSTVMDNFNARTDQATAKRLAKKKEIRQRLMNQIQSKLQIKIAQMFM